MSFKSIAGIILALIISFALLMAASFTTHASDSVRFGERGPAVVELQEDLRALGYTVKVDGVFGVRTLRAVNHFQRANGWRPVAQAGPKTLATLERLTAAKPVVRTEKSLVTNTLPPPTPVASGPCAQWASLLQANSPGWNVSHFQRIMYRESRCIPSARNPSGASGLLQIMPFWVKQLGHCGVYSTVDLLVPEKNVCGAAHIYRVQGINAWSQTK